MIGDVNMDYFEQEKELIIEEILKKVRPCELIDYKQFIDLYEQYKNKMSELEFAEILEISYKNFFNVKKYNKRAKILKSKKYILNNEEQETIVKEVLTKVKAGQSINYDLFTNLYQPYKNRMSEIEFADILEIESYNFYSMKTGTTNLKILKSRKRIIINEEKEIINEVLTKVERGQSINYDEFMNLYQPYKNRMSEIEFANILNITSGNYKNMIYKKQNVRILKYKKGIKKEQIIQEVLKKVYIGQIVNYKKFKILYEPYENILKEEEFAKILDISCDNFNRLKYKKGNVKVLKFHRTSDEEIDLIILDILTKINPGQFVNYEQFKKLYEPYNAKIGVMEFASILEISYSNLKRIIKKGGNVKVLKSKEKILTENEKNKIKNEILKKINIGQTINYDEFINLYKKYELIISEEEFAKILGISVSNLINIRNNKTNAIVKDEYLTKKINRIKYVTSNSRYYTKHEIENLANKFQISIKEIIVGIYNLKREEQINAIINLLDTKGKIWIGKEKCTNFFIEKYAEYIIHLANKICNYYNKVFKFSDIKEDCISDSILFIYEKCGEIEKNFYDNEALTKKIISYKLLKFIKFRYLSHSVKKVTTISILTNNSSNNRGIKDNTINIEQELEEAMVTEELNKLEILEEKCMYLLCKYLEKGYTKEESIDLIEKILGLNRYNLIDMLKQFMTNKQMVKKTNDGKYILR